MPFIDRGGLDRLLKGLVDRGYELVGPTVRDGVIVLDRIEGVQDLPAGVGEDHGPGSYRLVQRGDEAVFGFAHGPDSAKRFLFPPSELLATVTRDGGRLAVTPAPAEAPRYAFIGLRACDLHAVSIQDKVFGRLDPMYAARREGAFFVGVNCREPGATCFCASTGAGPRCTSGFDLALTELTHGFVVDVGTDRGKEILEAIDARQATAEESLEAERLSMEAAARMGRALDTEGLPELLRRNRESPEWRSIADICLACGNCTAVCPTCFCHDVVDGADLLGQTATRTREWATCFSEEFSHIAGTEVRSSRGARYRQWLTHKFSGWVDQFGTSGCVGCGRCITWCPVGIDVTREIEAIRRTDGVRENVEVGA
jgi:ferredoxin